MKKNCSLLFILLACSQLVFAQVKLHSKDERMKWWREARFGMFIHWGGICTMGRSLSWT
ncbi:alpha-L-fucosidase [Pedobacter lusitanus]|uniref:alpha-L-fucosidase n=1 Tax=Pedobacter lusitanus TaxID=1503925 RepID=UPI00269200E7|nr:alpha-L-fucosidase [Pedobacter lusitanus]